MIKYAFLALTKASIDLEAGSQESYDMVHHITQDLLLNEQLNKRFKHQHKKHRKSHNARGLHLSEDIDAAK